MGEAMVDLNWLCKWLEENSSGVYRPSREAAHVIRSMQTEIDYLRAVLSKAGEQKPVFEVGRHGKSGDYFVTELKSKVKLHKGMKLYAHPAPQQAIPEGWREVVEAVAHIGIDFGYGAFELSQEHIDKARALLSASPKP